MARKTLTQDQLRAMIEAEVEKAGLVDKPQHLTFYGVEEQQPDGPNWTLSFDGPLMFSTQLDAFSAIIQRLTAEFDIQWQTRH